MTTVLDSANAKFAIMPACRVTRECQRVYRLVSGHCRQAGEDENAVHSLRSDRYCVSLIDTDQSRNTGKYYDS